MDQVTAELLKSGILGAAVIGLSIFVWRMWKTLNAIQECRVKESQQVTDKLIGLSDKWNATLGTTNTVLTQLNESVRDLKDKVKK